jgi:DNA-binding PadR family transcriptional regulator
MLPSQRLDKLNTIENLWIYILLLIQSRAKNNPLYAWELPEMIQKHFNFRPGKITPYRVLYRLELQGLVESKYDERKRYYQITSSGKKELETAISFYKNLINTLEKDI